MSIINLKVALHNLGCKVNAYETEAMEQMLKNAGCEIVSFEPGADVYIINTCSVTNIADRKSRQMLHKAKKMNPGAIVIAAGCYTETADKSLDEDMAVDIIIGNNRKKDIVNVLNEFLHNRKKLDTRIGINDTSEYEEMTLEQMNEHTRAYIKIQDGCNQFCSYCIIPYARGRVRSRRFEDIKKEVEGIASKGFKEIVLTGIHLSSYGVDFENVKESLIDVIEMVASIEGIERVRLGSLEPRIITDEFIERLGRVKEICPHFHLSLQSGCDSVLKRMNRKYTSEEFKKGCNTIRNTFPDAAITTDVIVGFPGETEEEFEATKAFVENIGFAEMHIFKYSKRHGTVAAKMEHQVDEQLKTKRSSELITIEDMLRKKYRSRFEGRNVEVLFEEQEEIDGTMYFTGYTKEYVKVAIETTDDLTNILKTVRVESVYNHEVLTAR